MDAYLGQGKLNFWLAEQGKTRGEGFTIKVDRCARPVQGFQIKNKGKGTDTGFATKEFLGSGSFEKNGPWKTLIQDELIDTTGGRSAHLLNFTMDKPVKIKFLKFELVSFWGEGGGFQYFAPIAAT